jgi:(S)-sulfolactate dehydrogenase
MMVDILITEFMDGAAVDGLRRDYDVLYDPGLVDRRGELLGALAGARALIVRNRTQVDGAVLDAAPALAVVGRLGVGLDNIDVAACEARGVDVCPALGANAVAVAEYVVAALLILFRGAFRATDRVVVGDWPRTELAGREIAGKQLGLVGFGAIAREVAPRAIALGMTVAAHDPYIPSNDAVLGPVRIMALPDLLRSSEALSIHVPLNDETRHLIDAEALELLPTDAVLVNTARGGVVDEDAVVDALRAGRLGGAALDVFESEPVDGVTGTRFKDVPNLLLTPHIAGITLESNARVSDVTARNVREVLERDGGS